MSKHSRRSFFGFLGLGSVVALGVAKAAKLAAPATPEPPKLSYGVGVDPAGPEPSMYGVSILARPFTIRLANIPEEANVFVASSRRVDEPPQEFEWGRHLEQVRGGKAEVTIPGHWRWTCREVLIRCRHPAYKSFEFRYELPTDEDSVLVAVDMSRDPYCVPETEAGRQLNKILFEEFSKPSPRKEMVTAINGITPPPDGDFRTLGGACIDCVESGGITRLKMRS